MSDRCLSVAVVGHANTGKTSLIRTLLRDTEFGEVADHAGTTRHVEGSELVIDKSSSLALFDTPGLEDSIRLLAILQAYFVDQRVDGIERLQYFLSHIADYPDLEQEAKVLRALLNNNIVFYVIDLREPILGKYLDELQILSYAAKPVIPVLNFTKQGNANLQQWKTQLARLNFHAFVTFDSVHFNFADELKIYQKMHSLLADKESLLDNLIKQRQKQWSERFNAAKEIVALLFVQCACVRYQTLNNEHAIDRSTHKLQKVVRQAEKKCINRLLRLYQFRKSDLQESELPVGQDGWKLDLFSADNLQVLGIKLTGNIAKGAGAGVAIDLLAAGMSLGAAAVTGGFIGALWGVKQRYYDEIEAKIKGFRYICLDDLTLQVLWLRQLKLLAVLQKRGHASFAKITYQTSELDSENVLPENWDKWLRQLRSHPNWSSLNLSSVDLQESERQLFIEKICALMVRDC